MGKYISKTEGVDPERGSCLMLYPEKVEALADLPDSEFVVAIRCLFLWFIGRMAKEDALAEIGVKCKNKLLSNIMRMIFDGQTRYATAYIEKCNRKKHRTERNAPCYGIFGGSQPTKGEISHLESAHENSSGKKAYN